MAYIAQDFSGGILYVEDGNWSSFRKVDWLPAPAAPQAQQQEQSAKSEGGLSGGTSLIS